MQAQTEKRGGGTGVTFSAIVKAVDRDAEPADPISPPKGSEVVGLPSNADYDYLSQHPSTDQERWDRRPDDEPTHRNRRRTPIAESLGDVNEDIRHLGVCGDGDCPDCANPFDYSRGNSAVTTHGVEDGDDRKITAGELCDSPRPMSVAGATEMYLRLKYSRHEQGKCSLVHRTREKYRRLLDADREMHDRYGDALTIVLVSLRLSPLDENGRWLSPITLAEQLRGAWQQTSRKVRNKALDGYDYERAWILAGTDSAATPHRHAVYWIRDPNDDVEATDFKPVVEKHVEKCGNAYHRDHPITPSGDVGTVTLRHDPTRYDTRTRFDAIARAGDDVETEGDEPNTETVSPAAYYLGGQLPHWALVNRMRDDATVTETEAQTGAIAWADSGDWYRNGVR